MTSDLSICKNGESEPCPERFNMARYVVADPAARWPDKTALIVTDGAAPQTATETWTFADIDETVRRAAGALLARGLERGDRVLIRIGDTPRFPIAYFGTIAAGGIAMPLSSQLSVDELSYIAADATPRFAILDAACPAFETTATRLAPEDLNGDPAEYADTHRDDPAQLVYTSGTSGKPKGVLHAQRSVWARRMMRAGWHDMRRRPGDAHGRVQLDLCAGLRSQRSVVRWRNGNPQRRRPRPRTLAKAGGAMATDHLRRRAGHVPTLAEIRR